MRKSRIFFITLLFVILIIATACSSKDNITGGTTLTVPDIYEDAPPIEEPSEEQLEPQTNESQETEAIQQNEAETEIVKIGEEDTNIVVILEQPEEEEFKFSPESIVSTQNNISLSLDSIKHEIKSEYWGKITAITATVLNKGNKAFKPKLLVILYDEKDFKEEWLKPKAEIEFELEKLNIGEHTTRDAIVSISFDDISLTKHFKLILVDAADPGNKPLVVVEKEFNPLLS